MAAKLGLVRFSSQIVLAILLAGSPMLAISDALTDLKSAREQLAASLAAAKTAKQEFRTLLDQGGLTQSEKEDFQIYLAKLEQVIFDNCAAVLSFKVVLGDNSPEAGCSFNRTASTEPVSFPDERTEDEHVISLDSQLSKSMSDFDELLLREMEELKRRQSSSADGQGGAGISGGEEQQDGSSDGVATTDKGEERSGENRTQQNQSEQKGQQKTASRQSGDEQSVGGRGQNSDNTTKPTKRDAPPEDSDDDIVARQLREAAESETDPELREKLWEEYRRYKADTAAKSN